ncbi:hypothetical protein MJO28_011145 [Puccinia striiformis f. sp. tritici]|uniref:Uncharacterized protein n=1 Tax=Puccinia striiformis f. sp. tritici TaxID=168172 RepID=A0ACC0E1V0_9BASI|nr:hypothetical protein MJO28_011145 [Puccinia striiformis f. sp. tritici]
MSDHQLCLSTASELLSIDQEYEMCDCWALDDDKLTFIIFERNQLKLTRFEIPTQETKRGDVNLFLSPKKFKEEEEGGDPKREETKSDVKKSRRGELETMIGRG